MITNAVNIREHRDSQNDSPESGKGSRDKVVPMDHYIRSM